MTTRRQFVALGALAAAPAIVRAQHAWPTRPVRIFVGSSAGGSVDIPTRNLAARLSQRFGQQFIVENRAGAGGVIAAQAVVKSGLFMSSVIWGPICRSSERSTVTPPGMRPTVGKFLLTPDPLAPSKT